MISITMLVGLLYYFFLFFFSQSSFHCNCSPPQDDLCVSNVCFIIPSLSKSKSFGGIVSSIFDSMNLNIAAHGDINDL